jgi:hypothetical protein
MSSCESWRDIHTWNAVLNRLLLLVGKRGLIMISLVIEAYCIATYIPSCGKDIGCGLRLIDGETIDVRGGKENRGRWFLNVAQVGLPAYRGLMALGEQAEEERQQREAMREQLRQENELLCVEVASCHLIITTLVPAQPPV